MTLEELLAALQALIDNATAEGRDLTEEEAAAAEDLNAEIQRAQTRRDLLTRSRALTAPVAPAIHPAAVNTSRDDSDDQTRAFEHYMRTGKVNSELVEYRAQGEATGAAGGYLVPEGFRNKLIERMKAFGGIANGAEILTTDSGQPLPYPTNDDTSNTGEIVNEGGTFASGADLVFGTKTLQAYKFMAGGASNLPLKVSYELLQDGAFNVSDFVAKKLGERMARKQAASWAVGTGVNEPTGLLSAAGGLAGATALSSNSAPTYADLVAIVHDLDPAYWDGSTWVFNAAFLEVLRNIVDDNGRPLLWGANGNLSDGMGGMTLLGYPVIVDQACPSPSASNKFGFFGRLADAYVIRRVKDVTLVTLNELYAPSGQVGYMAWARADGMVQDTNAGVLLVAHS